MRRIPFALLLGLLTATPLGAQSVYTHADTLRGSDGPGRAWWDVTFYDLHVAVSPADSTIAGSNGITYRVTGPSREMQIDLQRPMVVDSIVQEGRSLMARRDGNAFFVTLAAPQPVGSERTVTVYFHGRPVVAKTPPWDGGFIWQTDSLGAPWVATANEGLGASAWWPNKDYLADEPDSQRIAVRVPDPMVDVSNGRLRSTVHHPDGTTTYEWFVEDPINNYDVAVNAGSYVHYAAPYEGESGTLTMDFWPLAYHLDAAKAQWLQAASMMKCFEHWFGPYPWYRDGYKLIEAPHLGMEHQSGIAYGNKFRNGYLGQDLSGTGLGLAWDYIVVHESAHEWWGNNITMKDQADMWIHESFAAYAEGIYEECQKGPEAGARYLIGTRRDVRGGAPIIPDYGVNAEGSGDMYFKGANMLHTMRQIVGDDARWRDVLRGLNQTFRHQTVTAAQVEGYMSQASGVDLSKVFQQYLTTGDLPVLEYAVRDGTLRYRWTNVVPGFDMPVKVWLGEGRSTLLRPTDAWRSLPLTGALALGDPSDFEVDRNYYVRARDVGTDGH